MLNSSTNRGVRKFLIQYNEHYFKVVLVKSCLIPGFELTNFSNYDNNNNVDVCSNVSSISSEASSLSRSKRTIRDLVLTNDFDYFITLTVNSKFCDRYSLSDTQDKVRYYMRLMKLRSLSYDKNLKFKYLFITEQHKDGAFHFHGFCKGCCPDTLYRNKNGFISCKIFDRLGYNSFSKVKDYKKASSYICKYITKDCIKNEHNQIYFCSKYLLRPTRFEIMSPIDFPSGELVKIYENDYIKSFSFDTISDPSELLREINISQYQYATYNDLQELPLLA